MKRIICLILCLLMLLTLAACGNQAEPETTIPQEATQETTDEATTESTEPEQPTEQVSSFYMDLKNQGDESFSYLNAYINEDSTAYMDYTTASGRKIAYDMDATVLKQLAAAYRNSALNQLNGQEIFDEGEACCSVSIVIGEETCSYSYYGSFVPEEYATIFADMEALFVQLMADVPEYVPAPQVGEGVNDEHLTVITDILNNSGIEALDALSIMDVPNDEYFGFTAGLTSYTGIAACTSCTPLMMATPYSLVVVTMEEGADSQSVVDDFRKNVDWLKWVCVQPSNAIIATKDNMVLCLLGFDEMYTGTAAALDAAGWTTAETLSNPNL